MNVTHVIEQLLVLSTVLGPRVMASLLSMASVDGARGAKQQGDTSQETRASVTTKMP